MVSLCCNSLLSQETKTDTVPIRRGDETLRRGDVLWSEAAAHLLPVSHGMRFQRSSVHWVRRRRSAELCEWKLKTKPWSKFRETQAGGGVWSPRFRLTRDEKATRSSSWRRVRDW